MGLTEFYSTPRRRLEVGHHFTTTFWVFTSLPLMTSFRPIEGSKGRY